eukprot:scaffold16110_cov148-Isochrysis_galbana.AAC.6
MCAGRAGRVRGTATRARWTDPHSRRCEGSRSGSRPRRTDSASGPRAVAATRLRMAGHSRSGSGRSRNGEAAE